MTLRAVWTVITSRPAVAIAAACFAAWLVLEYGNHQEKAAVITAPRTLDTVGRALDWPSAPLPGCEGIAELKPPAKERKRLEERFGIVLENSGTSSQVPSVSNGATVDPKAGNQPPMFPLASPALSAETRILAYKTVPAAPDGGEVLATWKPGDPQIALDFRANPRPFKDFKADYGMGVAGGMTDEGRRWRAYGFLEPMRIGRFDLRISGGGEARDEHTGWFAEAALELRP